MIHLSNDTTQAKGWFFGPWNSSVPIPVGFANAGIQELHYHQEMYEIYLVARGTSTIRVNDQTITLQAGDALAVEPTEAHTFLAHSDDYLHFVIQAPFVVHDKINLDS